MYALQYTNRWNEKFYFVATGVTHFCAGLSRTIHLIESTTPDVKKARHFESKEDAELILARTGNAGVLPENADKQGGWEIVPV